MLDSIRDEIKSCFKQGVRFVDNDWSEWNSVLEGAKYIPVEYTDFELIYQKTYIKCFYDEVIDLSMIIYQNSKAIGVWPLTLSFHDSAYYISSNEKEVLPPYFIDGISDKVKKTVISSSLNAIRTIYACSSSEIVFDKWKTRCSRFSALSENKTTDWFRKNMEMGGWRMSYQIYM